MYLGSNLGVLGFQWVFQKITGCFGDHQGVFEDEWGAFDLHCGVLEVQMVSEMYLRLIV